MNVVTDYGDRSPRPILHEVSVPGQGAGRPFLGSAGHVKGYSETAWRHRYEWDINDQLKKAVNELSNGTAVYSYDQFGSLVSARESGFDTIFQTRDTVGNLYETQDESDRIYGAGSRLEQSGIDLKERRNRFQGGYGKCVTQGTRYFYDEEGNLARKIEPGGGTWDYEYFGNNMLKSVSRPDKGRISFKYDALGRRIEKSFTKPDKNRPSGEGKHKITRFLWDGNTLLHEWEEAPEDEKNIKVKVDYRAEYLQKLAEKEEKRARQEAGKGQRPPESLVTWVFQGDFTPAGKITKEGCYSIVSDYLGTPVEAYDGSGKKVWERELDIYGRIKPGRKDANGRCREEIEERNLIPFRFPGQYEDEETGLYYNRFRYYDPQLGQYTQQDPIGLEGANPTLYGYVDDSNIWTDLFGLDCHHIATNKHKDWSDKFRELFKKNGIGKFKNGKWRKDVLNDPRNKVNVPGHKGPHPRKMHEEIYRRLLKADAKGSDEFVKELEELARQAQQPGSWLNKILTKK